MSFGGGVLILYRIVLHLIPNLLMLYLVMGLVIFFDKIQLEKKFWLGNYWECL